MMCGTCRDMIGYMPVAWPDLIDDVADITHAPNWGIDDAADRIDDLRDMSRHSPDRTGYVGAPVSGGAGV